MYHSCSLPRFYVLLDNGLLGKVVAVRAPEDELVHYDLSKYTLNKLKTVSHKSSLSMSFTVIGRSSGKISLKLQ